MSDLSPSQFATPGNPADTLAEVSPNQSPSGAGGRSWTANTEGEAILGAETRVVADEAGQGPLVTTLATVGHPTSGTWKTGQSVVDSNGVTWNCTAGGTPGTWVQSVLVPSNNLSDVASASAALGHLGGLSLAGGTMTGALDLAADPTANLGATPKRYVDERARWTNAGNGNPNVLSLWGCQVDETIATAGTGTPSVSADTANFKIGTQGWQLNMAGAGTGIFAYILPATITANISAVGLWVYAASLTGISSVTVTVWSGGNQWQGSLVVANMVVGWNFVRWAAPSGTLTGLAAITKVDVYVVSTGAASVTIGRVWAECPPKAQFVIIADGAYFTDFVHGNNGGTSPGGISFVGGYPDLKALGVPVVFAPDTTLVGNNSGSYAPPSDRSSWAQLAAVMDDGNGNEMNYHGSSGNPTSSMTSAQIVTEVMTAIKALQAHGYPNPPVKGAWSQNEATNAAAAQPLMLGYRTPTGNSGTPVACWPPVNMFNIPCQQLDQDVDWTTVTTTLQQTHGIVVSYVHGIDPIGNASSWTTPAQWGLLLDFLAAGISGGWLQAVTFNMLLAESGAKYRQTAGDWSVEYFDAGGTIHHALLP